MRRVLAFFLVLLCFPFIFIVAIMIRINYPGTFFYEQVREGKNGKPFKIIKLRTMVKNSNAILEELLLKDELLARKWLETGVLENDPRIAGRIGRMAREFSIDELPQLFNILKGEMAFIGPRPLEISSLEAILPKNRAVRSTVLPGVTGLAQVCNRKASIRQMQFYDKIYIKNQGLKLDLYILLRTFISVVKRTGA